MYIYMHVYHHYYLYHHVPSMTTHFDAGTPSFFLATLYIIGSGFFLSTSSPAIMISNWDKIASPNTYSNDNNNDNDNSQYYYYY